MTALTQGSTIVHFMTSDANSISTAQRAVARLQAILNASHNAILILTREGIITALNPATIRLFGFSESELVGEPLSALIPQGDRGENDAPLAGVRNSSSNAFVGRVREFSACRKDGGHFPVEVIIEAYEEVDQPMYLGIIRDISDEKKTRTGYLQKTSELQTVFEVLPDCFFRLSRDGDILDYHAGDKSRCFHGDDVIMGRTLATLFPSDVGETYRKAIARVNETLQTVKIDYELSNQPNAPVFEARLIPFLQQQIIVVIRERARSQAALTHYTTLAEALPVGFFLTDENGNYTYVNERWSEIADINVEEAKADGWSRMLHGDDRMRILNRWRESVTKGLPFSAEFRFRHRDGVIAWVYCQAILERFSDGSPSGYVGTMTDITDRIKADEALRRAHIELELRVEERTADVRAKNRYLQEAINKQKRVEKALRDERNFISAILETAGALVVLCNRDGRIEQFNRSAQETTHYTFDEVHGKFVWDIFLPDEEIEETKQIFQQLTSGKDRMEHESHWLNRNGESRLISWSNTSIRDVDDNVNFVVCIGIDITEQRQAEEDARQRQAELLHVSRLCTMGEMAAGLAHELNQPLAAIVSYTQGCVRRIASGSAQPQELLGAMKQVTAQAQRAGEIIKHLRAFVSKGELQRANVSPNTMVREVLTMAKIDIRKNGVTVRMRLADPLPTVNVDMVQIEQVLLNLIRNGMEAMSENDADQKELAIRTIQNQTNEIEFSVSDMGEGISPKVEPEKLFDAFFTTKKEGMGMGLAISRSIIEAHGGRLWATRSPDRGMTFQFTLPV